MSPGGPPSPPRRRRPRPPRGAAAPGTAAPRDAPRPRAWHGPARPGSGPPDLAFRPSGRRGSRAAGRGATGKATRAPWHPSLRFSPRFPSIVPFLPPPPLPRRPPASPSPNHSPVSFLSPQSGSPYPAAWVKGSGERAVPARAEWAYKAGHSTADQRLFGCWRTAAWSSAGPPSQQALEGSCLIQEQRGPPEQDGWEGQQTERLQEDSFPRDYQGWPASKLPARGTGLTAALVVLGGKRWDGME